MRHKNRRWLFVWAVMCSLMGILQCEFVKNSTNMTRQPTENATKQQEVRVFAPRMDYEQWTPIGRGDPLKNDPTYDYVPPLLDRVHYWADPTSRRPDPADTPKTKEAINPPKTEILVLGVSSKKPSIPNRAEDPYMKYAENANFKQNHYQRERIYFPSYSHYFPSAASSSSYNNYKTKHSERERYKSHQQQIPYTILMPPPLPKTETRPTTEATATQVTVQQSSLIYHSSTLSDSNNLQSIRERDEHENYHTADSSSVTWRTPLVVPHHQQQQHQEYKKTTSRPATEQMMYKMGKVENAHMDAMNTYVNIGKPEAHIQSEMLPQLPVPSVVPNNLVQLLKNEVKEPLATMTSFLAHIPKATTKAYTTTPLPAPSSTTISNTLTTDPLFRHYKQPAEPLRGPMYLIIQGHSKVKTYGPAKQLFGINVQEINEIPNYDSYKEFPVKHLHAYRRREEYHPTRNGRAHDLQNLAQLAQTGFGAIEDVDVKETDLVAGFEVRDGDDTNGDGEVYHKGIVEEASDDAGASGAETKTTITNN